MTQIYRLQQEMLIESCELEFWQQLSLHFSRDFSRDLCEEMKRLNQSINKRIAPKNK